MPLLAHRIRLDPNSRQRSWLERCAGGERFAWNWGLSEWQRRYEAGEKISWQLLNRAFNERKKTDLAWTRELPWYVFNHALANLGGAFAGFFRRVKHGDKPGYPRFKKRGRTTSAFSIETRGLIFDRKRVKLPKLGWVRMREAVRFPGTLISARFTQHAGHWYVAVQVEVPDSWVYPHRCETQAAVGVDLGLRDLAVLSDGTRVQAPRALRRYEAKLRRLNQELSRRTKHGKNWRKTQAKLGRLYERIANVRADVTHKLTASLVERFRVIGIEDLCVRGMARGRLAKSVLDAAPAEIRRQLTYKAPLAGSLLVVADRFFPSSKRCSRCGHVLAELGLGTRRWTCPACGAEHDRDENAAENLKQVAVAHTATACRPGSADVDLSVDVKLLAGQEPGDYVFTGEHVV